MTLSLIVGFVEIIILDILDKNILNGILSRYDAEKGLSMIVF
jgi:hypothetical protein